MNYIYLTLEWPKWKALHVCINGGQKSMTILREWWDSVRSVRNSNQKQYQHHYNHGTAQVVLGTEFAVLIIVDSHTKYVDKSTKNRVFNDNDLVYICNYSRTSNIWWIPGWIKRRIGNVVILQDNNLVLRNVNQLKIRAEKGIPELEASSHTTVRNTRQSSQTNSATSSGTSRYPVWSQRALIRFADEDWS